MQALSNWKKITGILLCASLTGALFSGCKKGDDTFPSIDYGQDPSEQTEETEETLANQLPATRSASLLWRFLILTRR